MKRAAFATSSTHPMFGPTFASMSALSDENAIIITEGDHLGRVFFKDLYQSLRLNIFEYTFEEHDETVAYSLSIPFVSTFAFAATMKHQDAPGTTFKRHMAIARGVLGEDDYLLQEILFNPRPRHRWKGYVLNWTSCLPSSRSATPMPSDAI